MKIDKKRLLDWLKGHGQHDAADLVQTLAKRIKREEQYAIDSTPLPAIEQFQKQQD